MSKPERYKAFQELLKKFIKESPHLENDPIYRAVLDHASHNLGVKGRL